MAQRSYPADPFVPRPEDGEIIDFSTEYPTRHDVLHRLPDYEGEGMEERTDPNSLFYLSPLERQRLTWEHMEVRRVKKLHMPTRVTPHLGKPFTVPVEKHPGKGPNWKTSLKPTPRFGVDPYKLDRKKFFQMVEIQGNLFKCPVTDSIAHCISKDVDMMRGVAAKVRHVFGGVDEIKGQGCNVGDVAVLKRGRRFVYNLVIKSHSQTYACYSHLYSALCAMKAHCLSHGVTSLAMPRLGCNEFDELKWNNVVPIIDKVFSDAGIDITIYTYHA